MNINKSLSADIPAAKAVSCFQKMMVVLVSVMLMSAFLPLHAVASGTDVDVNDTIPAVLDTVPSVVDTIPSVIDTVPSVIDTVPVSQDTVACTISVPYLETFDTCAAVGLTAIGTMPSCWSSLYTGTEERYRPHVTDATSYVISAKSLVIFSSKPATFGEDNYVVFPEITSNLNGLEISFQAVKQYYSAPNYNFSLGYFNGDVAAGNFVPLDTVPVVETVSSFHYSLNGKNIPQGAWLAFRQQGGAGTSFYAYTLVDSIAIDFLDCAPVSDVSVSDVMMTTAHVVWTPGAWETAWRVEYGESGFVPGTGMAVTVTTPYADLTGLEGETTYDVYVQAACDPANLSDYSEPVSFRTYCSVLGDTAVVESCDRYEWRDSVYTESGIYFDTVPRVADASCDSVYTLDLTIHRSVYRFDTLVLCQNQLPYQWADTTFEVESVDGVFMFIDTTEKGCDSIVELALFINPAFYLERYDTICENDLPYIWNDTVFDEGTVSGSYVFSRNSQFGCDSIVTLHLVVNQSYDQLELLRICEHELPVTWRDTIFYEGTQSGVYTFRRFSEHGCDSLVTLALYVLSSDTVLKEDTICASQLPYTWQDTTFEVGTATGYYMIRGNLSTACENTLLHLVVGGFEQDMNNPDTLHICRNELPYVWHGNLGDVFLGTNTTRGLRRVTVSAGGCTDVYFLFIDLLESGDSEISETICSSQLPYRTCDTTFLAGTQSGTYIINRPAGNGCTTWTTLHLTVNPSYQLYDTLVICDDQLPYRWRNEWLQVGMTTGDYNYNRTTALGCDSVVHLNLTVNRTYSEVLSLSVCENELPVEWRGHLIPRGTASQTLVFDESSVTGCDSLVMLNLTVNPVYRQEEDLAICSGDLPYVWRDTTFDEGTLGGTYLFEKQSVSGCDSTVVLHLTVNSTKEEYVTVDICRAELAYRWRDTTFAVGSVSGTYIFNRHTVAGCDSVVTLTLNIHESFGSNEHLVVCENELPVIWRDKLIPRGTQSGNIVYREQTAFGCDSIVILSIVVNPAYHQNEELTICENDLPYEWRDITFPVGTRGGSFIFERQSASGCDSIVRLNLTVNPSYEREKSQTICAGDLPYVYGDTAFDEGTETGDYILHRLTVNGCDSVVTLHLTVNETYSLTDEVELCEGDFPYVYGDTVFGTGTQSGDYMLRRRTANGCDSIVTLTLTVYPRGYLEKHYELCSSDLPYVTEDTTFPVGTNSGLYNIHYTTAMGCDSIVSISLLVNPVYNEVVSEVICQNDLPYEWRDTVFEARTESGVYRFPRTTLAGCDSMVTLALIVNPSYELEEEADVCANGFPFEWRDTTFLNGTNSGDYVFYRQTVNGCDSVVTLHLNVHPVFSQTEQLSLCQSELPYQWRDTTFQVGTASGFYTFYRSSSAGCDSIVTLALTIYPSSTQSYNVRICSNDLPYTWNVTDTTLKRVLYREPMPLHIQMFSVAIVVLFFILL